MTRWPSASSRSQKWEPMKPAPPVTRTVVTTRASCSARRRRPTAFARRGRSSTIPPCAIIAALSVRNAFPRKGTAPCAPRPRRRQACGLEAACSRRLRRRAGSSRRRGHRPPQSSCRPARRRSPPETTRRDRRARPRPPGGLCLHVPQDRGLQPGHGEVEVAQSAIGRGKRWPAGHRPWRADRAPAHQEAEADPGDDLVERLPASSTVWPAPRSDGPPACGRAW